MHFLQGTVNLSSVRKLLSISGCLCFPVTYIRRLAACKPGRAEERMGEETGQLALARWVMRGVLGRERSRGRTVEKWRVKTKFCSTYKVRCYG